MSAHSRLTGGASLSSGDSRPVALHHLVGDATPQLRTTFELKMQDAKTAKASFEEMPKERLGAILAGALDVRADDLWEHSKPAMPAKWVAAMARAVEGGAKGRVLLRGELIADVRKMVGHATKPDQILRPLLDPNAQSLKFASTTVGHDDEPASESLDSSVVIHAAEVWSHLALTLPIGDPYLSGIAPRFGC